MFSFARSSSPSRMLPGADVLQLRRDHVEALAEVLLARADVDADLPGVHVLRRRTCRRSTPCRASRESPETAGTMPSRRGWRRAGPTHTGAGRRVRGPGPQGRRGTARCSCAGSGARAAARGRPACAAARARRCRHRCDALRARRRCGRGRRCRPRRARRSGRRTLHGGTRAATAARSSAITSARPITGRPSGCDPKTASAARSCTTSWGLSSTIAISSSTTSRSESMSVSAGEKTMSVITSSATSMWSSGTRV